MTDGTLHLGSPRGWPDCETDELRVMILGTYHMANPELDEVNVEADDVRRTERQRELLDLIDRLEPWAPDRVAVEYPTDRQDELDSLYHEYRSGGVDDRNEVVQVGFRFADRLSHERVYGVDDPIPISVDGEAPWNEGFESPSKLDYPRPDPDRMERDGRERLTESTISEYLRWNNQEPRLRDNHDLMFADAIPWGAGGEYEGAELLSGWYERNVRIVQNIWQFVESVDERVFLLVGAGHVRVLRHLLDEAPMFCPVSPLPYLE